MRHKTIGRQLLFVGGSPRSGTTLVQNMLDSHPDILGGPEFLHLPDIIDLRRKLYTSLSRRYIDHICTPEQVDSYLASLIEKFFSPLIETHRCQFYSEKSPMNILVFPELMDLFPASRFIQVVRDPRAIVHSLQGVKKRAKYNLSRVPHFTRNVYNSIDYVSRCFEAGSIASWKDSNRLLTIRFEELLQNPLEETKNICRFLGIEWSEKMLRPGEKAHLGEKAITVQSGQIWYDHDSYYRNPDHSVAQKWRKEMPLFQQIKTTLAFRDSRFLADLGYDLSLQNVCRTKPMSTRILYGYLQSIDALQLFLRKVVRKVPGVKYLKKSLSRLVRFLE